MGFGLGLGVGRLGRLGGTSNPIPGIIAKYGVPALYIPDFNPLRPAPSGLGRLYEESAGITPALDLADTLGLVLDEGQGAAVTNKKTANFASGVDGFAGGASGSVAAVGGELELTAGAANSYAFIDVTTVVGRWYRCRARTRRASGTAGLHLKAATSGFVGIVETTASTSTIDVDREIWFLATTTTSRFYVQLNSTGLGSIFRVASFIVDEVAGNHASQATAASRGTLRQVGSRYVWRGDGSDDNLLTTMLAGAAGTLVVACKPVGGGRYIAGLSDAGNTGGAYLACVSTTGFLAAGVGTQGIFTISGATDIRNVPGVAILRWTGSAVSLYWKPFAGSIALQYSAAQSGNPSATIPYRLGARNDNGTAAAGPFDSDIYSALAIQAALTDAEVAAVTAQFSR